MRIGRIDYCVYWPLSKQAVHPCNRKATRQSPLASRRLSGYGIGASQEPSESASGEEPGRHAAWSLLVRDPREQPHKGALYRIADGCWLTGMILLLTQVEVIEDSPRHAVARA